MTIDDNALHTGAYKAWQMLGPYLLLADGTDGYVHVVDAFQKGLETYFEETKAEEQERLVVDHFNLLLGKITTLRAGLKMVLESQDLEDLKVLDDRYIIFPNPKANEPGEFPKLVLDCYDFDLKSSLLPVGPDPSLEGLDDPSASGVDFYD